MLHKQQKAFSNITAKSIIVRNGFFEKAEIDNSKNILEIDGNAKISQIDLSKDMIIIEFEKFADGRGFSLAKLLRQNRFEGVIRAKGNLLVDQYPLAIRCGFDEIEISLAHAQRQPQNQWQEVLTRTNNNYLDRLMLA